MAGMAATPATSGGIWAHQVTPGCRPTKDQLQEVERGSRDPHVPRRADAHPRRHGGPGIVAVQAEAGQPLRPHGGARPGQDEEDHRRRGTAPPILRLRAVGPDGVGGGVSEPQQAR